MNCPNCGKSMTNLSNWSYGIGSWDMDYPDVYHEEYRYNNCKIIFINGEWKIPDTLRASDQQIKAAETISYYLHIPIPDPPLKTSLWKFIHDHMEESKLAKEQQFEDWCEENADWLPEYF